MNLSLQDKSFLDSFDELWTKPIDDHQKNSLSLFLIKLNANEMNYSALTDNLLEPVIGYAISRYVKKTYQDRPMHLSKKVREKFIDYMKNTGELGELFLYCFLETHLEAPKILSKLELKTSTSKYVNGADGVHFLRLSNGNYQVIFGESKTICELTTALTKAFESIHEFKTEQNRSGTKKSGLSYERGLISDNLNKETFTDEDKTFIENLIYPKKDNSFEVDDAFGIFIGYELKTDDLDKSLPSDQFRENVRNKVSAEIENRIDHIKNKILEYDLSGHNFYIYVVPFTDLDKNRKAILEGLLK